MNKELVLYHIPRCPPRGITLLALVVVAALSVALSPALEATSPPPKVYALLGRWYLSGNEALPCYITNRGGELDFTNEKGQRVAGLQRPDGVLVASGWSGLTGKLFNDSGEIRWANGSVWRRTPSKAIEGKDETQAHVLASQSIVRAAMVGDAKMVGKLLEEGTPVDTRFPGKGSWMSGLTPLMGAAEGDQPEVVRMLLARGADVHARSADGRTALFMTGKAHGVQIAEILIQHGARVDERDSNGNTPLVWAMYAATLVPHVPHTGDLDEAKSKAIASLPVQFDQHGAAMAQLLLKHGADPTARNKGAETALVLASKLAREWGQTRCVTVLEAAGARRGPTVKQKPRGTRW